MATYSSPPPPYVIDGKLLSAYFVNQLSDSINNRAGFVYGANVARWTYPGSESITEDEGVWMLQHKYNTLRINFIFGNTNMTVKVFLSKNDQLTGLTQIHSQTYTSDGPVYYSVDLTTNPGGFVLADGEMYFVRVEFSKAETSSDLFYVDSVFEAQDSAMVKPTIDTLTSSTVIDATYLNKLVDGARQLYQKIQPVNMPFVGVRTSTSVNGTNTFLRWKLKHLSRYLHARFVTATSGGGADGVQLFMNNQKIGGWANNSATVTQIFDMQALPNSVAEPTWGAEYELKFVVDRDAGAFTAVYLWELPYL